MGAGLYVYDENGFCLFSGATRIYKTLGEVKINITESQVTELMNTSQVNITNKDYKGLKISKVDNNIIGKNIALIIKSIEFKNGYVGCLVPMPYKIEVVNNTISFYYLSIQTYSCRTIAAKYGSASALSIGYTNASKEKEALLNTSIIYEYGWYA